MNGHVRERGKRADGTTKWQARYTDPDDPRKRIEKTFRTKREAQSWLTQQQAGILSGDHNDPRRADRPFAAAVEAWRETRAANLAPKTRDRYESVLRKYLLPEFAHRPLSSISREAVKRYFARLQREGRTPGTVKKVQTVLSSVLSEAVELGMLRVNPATKLRLPAPPARDQTTLTAGEVNALADAIDPHYRVLIYVAAYTGLRAGELWAMRRRDVDVLRGQLHVRQTVKRDKPTPGAPTDSYGREVGPPKNGRPRTISLPNHLKTMLGEHLLDPTMTLPSGGTGPDAMVFHTASGRPVRHTLFMREVFRPAIAVAVPHKPNLRFHDLRHTCATLLISAGAHAKLVQERLGHASITTTLNLYGHVLPSTEAALVDALDSLYEAAI
jgi:integrase